LENTQISRHIQIKSKKIDGNPRRQYIPYVRIDGRLLFTMIEDGGYIIPIPFLVISKFIKTRRTQRNILTVINTATFWKEIQVDFVSETTAAEETATP